MSQIILAKTAGFCFGVDRAVNIINKLLSEGRTVATLGPIIHNPQVIEDFRSRGVVIVDSLDCIPEGAVLVVRTHGVTKRVMEDIRAAGIDCVDATCPFVKKIQTVVAENSDTDTVTVICGDAEHPEVKGIMSYANGDALAVKTQREIEQLSVIYPDIEKKRIIFTAQTTFSIKEWEKNLKKVKILYTNSKIFDTICFATEERQKEAYELSLRCDAVIVVGGRQSSNTAKLAAVCSENCKTFLVEDASELNKYDFGGCHLIGVTAGASTPAGIIKEVLETMSEIVNENNAITEEEKVQEPVLKDEANVDEEEYDYAAALEESLNNYGSAKLVVGTVLSITPTEIQVDIGRKQTGYVPYDEYSSDPNADPRKELKVGDTMNLIIMKTNDQEGMVMLSKRICDAAKVWDEIIAAEQSGEILEGVVCDVIKGGILVRTKGIRVFIPGSLTGVDRDTDLSIMLNTTVKFRVIEVIKQRKKAVGSIRAVLKDTRREAEEAFWATAEVGQVITGTVKSMTNYGAFVDIGGIDGMIHISELSWKRLKHPSEVVNKGDVVEVYIKALDPENNKISLGYKKIEDSPWETLKRDYPVGTVTEVKIVGLTTFGAFAQVIPGIDGLIHISQIANRHIAKTSDVLKIGDVVTVKVTDIDFDKKRVSLSIRALLPPDAEPEAEAEAVAETEAPAEAVAETEAPAEAVAETEAPAEAVAEAEAPAEAVAEEEAPAEAAEADKE